MCMMNVHSGLYTKAKEIIRLETKILTDMPGYEMLTKAIVLYKVYGEENLYENVAKESAVIPLTKTKIQNMHPVEQLIFESMKSAGIDYENPKLLIEELSGKI